MQQQLVIYDAACQALARACSIDEVKEIQNRAQAARAYARQAQNRDLEIDALEIRVRAERRLGEILVGLKAEGIGNKGGPGRGLTGKRDLITLKDLGVSHNISARLSPLDK